MQVSEVDKWAGILPGSINHALKKMANEGLVKVANVESTGHRSKAIYEITDEGEKEYKKLLVDSFRVPSIHLPVHLYSGLSMLNLPNPEANLNNIKEAIEEQINELKAKMEQMEEGQKIKTQFIEMNDLTKITF
ncbi:PadR family transcriptional regulator [Metabacillus sp. RGM 3146]|uniref:PadR family transcriptional regulator n=1 Tax=Metabacillus sp. RGM 3146 TaxID=3401092 RepID=UPI003BA19B64